MLKRVSQDVKPGDMVLVVEHNGHLAGTAACCYELKEFSVLPMIKNQDTKYDLEKKRDAYIREMLSTPGIGFSVDTVNGSVFL